MREPGLTAVPVPSLQCLYCEKTFRDKSTLRDHMRKKQHRRINPRNREYDQFYIINYLVSLPLPHLECDCVAAGDRPSPRPVPRSGCDPGHFQLPKGSLTRHNLI